MRPPFPPEHATKEPCTHACTCLQGMLHEGHVGVQQGASGVKQSGLILPQPAELAQSLPDAHARVVQAGKHGCLQE
eukprot:710873-Pelagomonas_calceolata.AAC.3